MEDEFKVVMLGEGYVGKTSLILRYTQNYFTSERTRTTQAAYVSKTIPIDKKEYTINIWDTAGQEKYQALTPIYYRDSQGAVLVYDVNEPKSFERVKIDVKNITDMLDDSCVIIIVGNKMDLIDKETLETSEMKQYADSIHAKLCFTSCLTGDGVEDVFVELTKQMISKRKKSQNDSEDRRLARIFFEDVNKKNLSKEQGYCCK